MKLANKTSHSTAGLRAMFYDLARKAHVSTRKLTVVVLPSRRHVHGWCDTDRRLITLYLLRESTTSTISFLWVHELAHLTPHNKTLYRHGHSRKGQAHADAMAARVTGGKHEDMKWHKEQGWRKLRYRPAYPTKALARQELQKLRYPYNLLTSDQRYSPDGKRKDGFSFRISPKSRRGHYWLEEKYIARNDKREVLS